MATSAIFSDDVDHRLTCSLCFEEYTAEKQPKILPCFHTFCLQCLELLEKGVSQKQKNDVSKIAGSVACNRDGNDLSTNGESSKQTTTFSCPTCRTVITVPPGGVVQFQSNFYIGDNRDTLPRKPLPCEVCDGGPEATFYCGDCEKKFCSECERCHRKYKATSNHKVQQLTSCKLPSKRQSLTAEMRRKFQEQIKIVEAALACLGDEESEMERQRSALTKKINARCNNLITFVQQVQAETEENLNAILLESQSKINAEISKARQTHGKLVQIAHQEVTSSAIDLNLLAEQFTDDDLQNYQQRASNRGRQSIMFQHQASDDSVTLDSVKAYVGIINAQTAVECVRKSEPEKSLFETPRVAPDVASMVDETRRKLMELEARTAELMKKYSDLETDTAKLHQDAFNLRANVRDVQGENINLYQEAANLKVDFKACEANYAQMRQATNNLETGMAAIQGDNSKLYQETKRLLSDVQALQVQCQRNDTNCAYLKDKLNTAVAFHALLHANQVVGKGKIILYDKVLSNVGGGYKAQTGIFIAPVTGTYLFIATAAMGSLEGSAYFAIRVSENDVAFGYFERGADGSDTTCTAHAVVKVTAGQNVCIVTQKYRPMDTDSQCTFWGGYTHFSGTLLQQDL